MHLTTNVGSADRIARLIIGGGLVVLALIGTIGIWGWLGLILIGTAFLKFCPIYKITGLSTRKAD